DILNHIDLASGNSRQLGAAGSRHLGTKDELGTKDVLGRHGLKQYKPSCNPDSSNTRSAIHHPPTAANQLSLPNTRISFSTLKARASILRGFYVRSLSGF